jgi:hypothetical protein
VTGRHLQDLCQGAQDSGNTPVASRLEQEPVALLEVGELQRQLVE